MGFYSPLHLQLHGLKKTNASRTTPQAPGEPFFAPAISYCYCTGVPKTPGPAPTVYITSTSKSSREGTDGRPSEDKSFQAKKFAKVDTLSQWFPQIKEDGNNDWRIWLSRRSRALLLQLGIVGIIFVTNLALTIFAVSQYGSEKGVGLIYQGDCNTVKTLDQWIHLLINLLGTGMLSASNYCMQLQAAPTRANVNDAHNRGKFLDIGVPSLRNLGYTSSWRRFSWFLLAVSSIPIHLMILLLTPARVGTWRRRRLTEPAEANRAGDPGWDEPRVNPSSFNYTDIIHGMQAEAQAGHYEERNTSSCFDLYDDYWQPQGNGIIFVKNASSVPSAAAADDDDSLLMYVSIIPRSDDWAKNMWALGNGTGNFTAVSPPKPVTAWYLGPKRYEVSHCLVQPPAQIVSRCRFEYSPQIMFTVCVLNLVKAFVMLCIWVLRKWQYDTTNREPGQTEDSENLDKQILYTLGDAIASFMRVPDPTTVDMGLATRDDFLQKRTWKNKLMREAAKPPLQPRQWKKESTHWRKAASPRRWFTFVFAWFLVMLVATILLLAGLSGFKHRQMSTTIPGLWNLGFGALTPYTYIVIGLPRTDPGGLISNVLLANLPQLVLSIVYISYNGLLTTFLVQREFGRMYDVRKPLRVSEPIGIQRSSYFISLPLRYGIPLYASLGVMHWLLSQSLFLARITAFFPTGQVDTRNSFSTCGWSPIAVFTADPRGLNTALIAGGILMIAIVAIGFRRYDGTMRLVSTNSRAISAACHVLHDDRKDGYLLPCLRVFHHSSNVTANALFLHMTWLGKHRANSDAHDQLSQVSHSCRPRRRDPFNPVFTHPRAPHARSSDK
ncbi:hypothetical protein B0T22DRAFT_440679 [Podospora appendiculata]|uniref:DUF6536 domain-containing protein n=1 Tax=Podospora appendiculata TaxID=314037 RepID=A0AAE0XB31_9PEZI|nr:hypothetical protein B0T22DRAFT_440679 [Podospora appendiculata]